MRHKKNALKKIQSEAEHSGFAVVHVMYNALLSDS